MATKKTVPTDPEAVKKLVLDDPNTAKIAQSLGVPLEEYVNQVVHFVMHPEEEPNIVVAEDKDIEELGWKVPDPDAMGRFIMQAATVAQAADKTEFTDPRKKLVAMPEAPPAAGTSNPNLKAELEKQLKSGRGSKG